MQVPKATNAMRIETFHYSLLTKLCNLQGINRLGKAPPRPGSLRPPDPNRNRVLDIYSEGTEGDADYMRMVQDVSMLLRQTFQNDTGRLRRLSFLATSHLCYISCRLKMHSKAKSGGCLAEEVRTLAMTSTG